MGKAKILAFAGSTRKGSWNQMLLQEASRLAVEAGAEVTLVQLADYPMPIYDQDWESENGLPEAVSRLKEFS